MQITKIEYRQLALTMKTGFKTANDTTAKRPLILIAVTLDDEYIGYGEVQAFDNHAYATQDQTDALAWLTDTMPSLKNWQGEDINSLLAKLPIDGQFARAGLEMAVWDAVGKQQNKSLADMLGEHTSSTPVGIALGLDERSEIDDAIQAGYERIKLKQQQANLDELALLVTKYPNQLFSLDYNASLPDTELTHRYLQGVRDLGINLIEEPFAEPTLDSYHRLANELAPLKVSLDEQLDTVADVEMWLTQTDIPAYTLKQGKLGGIQHTLQTMTLIVQANKLAWIGGMLASGLGRAVDAALASQLPTPQYPADISQQTRYFTRDIVQQDLTFEGGKVLVPTGTGIGIELDWPAIEAQQIGPTYTYNLLQKP